MKMQTYVVVAALGAVGLLGPAQAETTSLDVRLALVQDGIAQTLTARTVGAMTVQTVQLAPDSFSIVLPAFDCSALEETVWVRVLPVDMMEEVERIVAQAAPLAEGEERNDVLFPYGSSYAANPGPVTILLMTLRPHRGYAWEFNYADSERLSSRSADASVVSVSVVYETWEGRDFLELGIPFVMMIGRPVCDQGAPRMAVDILDVTFGSG